MEITGELYTEKRKRKLEAYKLQGINILKKLTDEEMTEIAKLDKDERYYHRTDEQLAEFAAWKPDFEKA